MTARAQRRQPISTGSEWTFELIQTYDREISRLAERYALDTYPNQIEVITAEQMMDAYASVGMPLGYHHWSYGKQFLSTEKSYSRGQMGLAYEIVINSDPCIAYLMEENTMCMQALVIAHACYGHNSFSKAITCSVPGLTPVRSSTIWCSPSSTSPSAKSATVSMLWRT